ncbi:MAG: hypothetical protein OER56_13950 [Hyphomicrobiales bacterium]|nr:hypothetical protein [Hyphomicrobiales bacterium]
MRKATSTSALALFAGASTGNKIQLGTIHGVGTLLAEGRMYGGISYLIEIWREQNGLTRTDGLIDAKNEIIERVRRMKELILTLETGEVVPIIITGTISGHAEIRIIGPVPGYRLAHDCNVPDVKLSGRS